MIAIISHAEDPHADRVMELLRRDGHDVFLLDLAALPHHATVTFDFSDASLRSIAYGNGNGNGMRDLRDATAVWWRRPQAPDLQAIVDGNVFAFAHNEWQEALNGMWQLLDVPWMNPPARDEVAGRKLLQLRRASELGMRIPRTLVTSNPDAAREFVAARGHGKTIFKTFSCTHEIWRETRLVEDEALACLDQVRLAPVIFQEYIDAGADIRATIVGRRVFAAAIDASETDYPVDFRMSLGGAQVAPVELPRKLVERLLAFMNDLGLVYGALDLRRTPEGEYVFLEVNTAGEFLFIEERTALPISRAIADWLTTPA